MSVTVRERHGAPAPVEPGPAGAVLVLVATAMFFAGLLAAYVSIRAGADTWPPEGAPELDLAMGIGLTVAMLAAGGAATGGAGAARRGDRRGLARWLGIAAAIGIAFLAGSALAWATSGLGVADGAYAATFYALTGAHFALVFGAVVVSVVTSMRASGGHLGGVMGSAAPGVWHLTTAVWLALFAALHVLGRAS